MKTIIFMLLLLSSVLVAYDEGVREVPLTQEKLNLTEIEQQYLNKHKKIPLCLHPIIFPIDGFEDGEHTGIMSDIYLEISKKTRC